MKKRFLATVMLALMLCALALPAFAASYATVFGGWLRLRANPSYEAAVLASYRNGSVVTVLSTSGGWARVLTGDYRVGYMDMRYLNFGTQPAPQPTAKPYPHRTWTEVNRTAFVTSLNGKGVRLRSTPEVNSSNVMGLYPVGRTVKEIRRSNDGWSYIRIDGKYGYMMSQYLMSYSPAPVPVPPTAKPTAVPTWVPTAVPTATPVPSKDIQSVRLDPYQPTEGDTIKVLVSPADAEYTCVWYNDEKKLLSTSKQYKVTAADVGHVINVRVSGAGLSAGFVADAMTSTVKAAAKTIQVETEVKQEFVPELYNESAPVIPPDSVSDGSVVSEWVEDLAALPQ